MSVKKITIDYDSTNITENKMHWTRWRANTCKSRTHSNGYRV